MQIFDERWLESNDWSIFELIRFFFFWCVCVSWDILGISKGYWENLEGGRVEESALSAWLWLDHLASERRPLLTDCHQVLRPTMAQAWHESAQARPSADELLSELSELGNLDGSSGAKCAPCLTMWNLWYRYLYIDISSTYINLYQSHQLNQGWMNMDERSDFLESIPRVSLRRFA